MTGFIRLRWLVSTPAAGGGEDAKYLRTSETHRDHHTGLGNTLLLVDPNPSHHVTNTSWPMMPKCYCTVYLL
jgi:hypothetical protein